MMDYKKVKKVTINILWREKPCVIKFLLSTVRICNCDVKSLITCFNNFAGSAHKTPESKTYQLVDIAFVGLTNDLLLIVA